MCTTSLPRTGNRAFHPKRDRGGFRRPTLHQNKWDSFYPLQKVTYGRSAFLDREFFCPGLPAILALPADRTPGPYPLASLPCSVVAVSVARRHSDALATWGMEAICVA